VGKGIALALSGGGFRASLFHAGALRRMAEFGLLSQISKVSAVSGGSIVAGIWLNDISQYPDSTDIDRAKRIESKVRALSAKHIDARSIAGGIFNPFRSINETLVAAYQKHLFPDNPQLDTFLSPIQFTFCATNLSTGRNVYLDKMGIYDYRVGYHPKVLTIAEAVAASSAFPPFLSPFKIHLDSDLWLLSNYAKSIDRISPSDLYLTDGGAYDNLGLESVWNDGYDYILVSDAGAPFVEPNRVKLNWLSQSNSALEIAIDQARGARKRWLIEQFRNSRYDETLSKGAYWGIASDIADFFLEDAMPVNHDKSKPLKLIPTRLAPFKKGVDSQLINWGYAMCDTSLRKWRKDIIDPLAPPPQWPDQAFKLD
jgi:NTE family protein